MASKPTKRQKRMANIIRAFQRYVETYDADDNSDLQDDSFIKDMLYGIGISLDSQTYEHADGFDDFMSRIHGLSNPAGQPRKRVSPPTTLNDSGGKP